jgi:uncharacterized protein (DUF4213/DUF364 family)
VEQIAARVALPSVERIWLPPVRDEPGRGGEFGAVVLADGSVGLMFVQLGDTLPRLWQRLSPDADARLGAGGGRDTHAASGAGLDPVRLARLFRDPLEAGPRAGLPAEAAQSDDSEDLARRTLGLGAANAIGQHVIREAGIALDTETNSIASFEPGPADRVGMIGFFPPLVARLRKQGIDLTVIELKKELTRQEPGLRVTRDPEALQGCTQILGTSTMLLNDSLDRMLAHCEQADQVAIIGPGAGFLPDPFFARGVDTVGGHQVVDIAGFLERCAAGRKWGDTSRKYCLHRDHYPGLAAVLGALDSAPRS